ncbi:MAG: hypothetical protein IKG42_06650 [Clostridia bacterium]|nr:hypothetical protein [Clostridia bacterium]
MKNKFLSMVIIIILSVILVALILFGGRKDDNKNENNNSNNTNVTNVTNSNSTKTNNTEVSEEVLKVGNYTLQYGKYSGDSYINGTDVDPVKVTYVINSDGTYSYYIKDEKNYTGTYTVKDFSKVGLDDTYGVEFEDGSKLIVPKNDTLRYIAGAESELTFVGK